MKPIINSQGFHVGNVNTVTHNFNQSPNFRIVDTVLPVYDETTQAARYLAGGWSLVDKKFFQGNKQFNESVRIKIRSVLPVLMNSTNENEYTVAQNVDVTIIADVDCDDSIFRIPIIRTDTSREVPIIGTVKNKVLTVVVNFPTAGYWECSSAQINSRLPEPLFDMPTIQFVVV